MKNRINGGHLNLLPQHVLQYQRNRTLYTRMAITQIAILALFIVVALWVNMEYRHTQTQLQTQLNLLVVCESLPLQHELARLQELDAIVAEFIEAHYPWGFDADWIAAILYAAPPQATIMRIEYRRHNIVLEGTVVDAMYIEVHRQAVVDTGLFAHVWFGEMQLLECGNFSYVLRIGIGDA